MSDIAAPIRRRAAIWIALAVVFTGCAGDPWDRYEDSAYDALQNAGAEGYGRHADLLEELIQRADAEGRPPRPGMCLECALYMSRLGRDAEAQQMIARERAAYPQMSTFIAVVDRYFAGEKLPADDAPAAAEEKAP